MRMLVGVGIRGYRSFAYETTQYLAPLSKVNLIAGQNNAGKSNLLRFIDGFPPPPLSAKQDLRLRGTLDAPSGLPGGSGQPTLALAHTLDELEAALDSASTNHASSYQRGARERLQELLPKILTGPYGLVWVPYSISENAISLDPDWAIDVTVGLDSTNKGILAEASSWITGRSGGGNDQDLLRVVSNLLPQPYTRVRTIPAFRRIQDAQEEGGLDGVGLIRQLARLESPDASVAGDRLKFEAVQEFARCVIDDPGLTLKIPYERNTINIQLSGGSVLPLENMGTGIQQVIILGVAATVLEDTVICMEEPEIHLHPILQRKLLRYLAESTTNQYLIATHSAHLLDSSVATIFHLARSDAGSQIRPAVTPSDRWRICQDLGYRASDLVQSNCVVWVEGPSDRLYIRRWLELEDPSLVEGLHYSLMFYGGRLLNHLTALDEDVTEFILLRRLNRHGAIVIDSDKQNARARLNATKTRVIGEFANSGMSWVTKGYTMENYVPEAILRAAINKVHPTAVALPFGLYDNPLGPTLVQGIRGVDKLAIARYVVSNWDQYTDWPLDLRRRVGDLAGWIRSSNG